METSKKDKIPGLGGHGEDTAVKYLENKSYRIIDRNYRTKFGEIDIVTKAPTGILVFVEVKTLAGKLDPATHLLPEDNLSAFKLRKLRRICQFFANAYPAMVGDAGWQIDLVAIVLPDQTSGKEPQIRHYENL